MGLDAIMRVTGSVAADTIAPKFANDLRDVEIHMADLVDLAIPANARATPEALGLKVHRSATSGARVRQIPREEAEIALECLRDWGVSARILEDMTGGPRP
jgi:hydrogenase maturation factor